MAIAQLGYHGFEGIEHVKISAGIKIGCGESGSGVDYEQIADSCRLRGVLAEKSFYSFSDIEDLAFLSGFDCDPLHDTVGLMAAADVPPPPGLIHFLCWTHGFGLGSSHYFFRCTASKH